MMMRANCFVSSSRVAPTVNWRRAGRASACWFVSTSQRLAGDLHVHEMFAHFLNEIARAARLCPINKEPVDIKQNNSVKCKTWQRRRLTDWNEAADPCGGESEWTKRKRRELAEASVPVAAGRCWCRRRISGAAGDKPRQFWPWRLFCGRRRWAKSGSGPAASTRSARRNGGLRRRHSRRRPSTILPSTRPTSAHTIPAAGSLLTLRASGCQSARATRLNCLPLFPLFSTAKWIKSYWYFLRRDVLDELAGGVVAGLLLLPPEVVWCPPLLRLVHPLQNSIVLRLSKEGNVWPNQRTRLCQICRYISVFKLLLRTSFNNWLSSSTPAQDTTAVAPSADLLLTFFLFLFLCHLM